MKVFVSTLGFLFVFGMSFSEGVFAKDICGNLSSAQCRQAYRAAIAHRQHLPGLRFNPLYWDHTGLSWGAELPGQYSNGCETIDGYFSKLKCTFEIEPNGNRQVRVNDSNAALACKGLGARLPTKAEISGLLKSFDHNVTPIDSRGVDYWPFLTDLGQRDLKLAIGEITGIWSSSLSGGAQAFYFDGASHIIYEKERQGASTENNKGPTVRCVR